MSLPRLARTVDRWRSGMAARHALSAAVYGDHDVAHQITAHVIERGPSAVRALAAAWCEVICADVPRRQRRLAATGRGVFGPMLTDPGTGDELDLAAADPHTRWAANLVVAYAGRDDAMCRDLLNAVPDTEIAGHLERLLRGAVAAMIERLDDLL